MCMYSDNEMKNNSNTDVSLLSIAITSFRWIFIHIHLYQHYFDIFFLEGEGVSFLNFETIVNTNQLLELISGGNILSILLVRN